MSDAPALVYLEADDEITAVIRRVRAADVGRVIVVAPGRSRATSSAVALRLLARAASDGTREVVVVGDALTRSLAAEAGIPAFATVDEARVADTGVADPEPPPHAAIHVVRGDATDETVARPTAAARPAPVARAADETRTVRVPAAAPAAARARTRRWPGLAAALAVAGVLVFAGAVAGATLLPAATITVTPRLVTVTAEIEVVVEEPERDGGTVEATATVTPTGEYTDRQPATGTVTFRNFNVAAVAVPTETLVAVGDGAGDQAFTTTSAVTVPPGQLNAEGRIAAGEADAPIVASAPGPAGNVEVGAIDVVLSEGVAAQLRLFPQNNARLVINAEPTSGGVDETGAEITEDDVAAAVEALRQDLRRRVDEVRPDFGDLHVVDVPAMEPQIDVPDGLVGTRDAEAVEITGSMIWEVVAVDVDAMEEEAAARLTSDPSVPSDHEVLPESLTVDMGAPVLDGERVVAQATVSASAAPRLDEDEIRRSVMGSPESEAEDALAELGAVDVALWPGWVTSVPQLDWRVDVRIGEAVP